MKSRKVVLSFETVDEILRCGHIKYIKKLKCLCPYLDFWLLILGVKGLILFSKV